MIVVDASAWLNALAGPSAIAESCRALLQADDQWMAPGHMATEILRTLRRLESAGQLTPRDAQALVNLVAATAVTYVGPEPSLLAEQWRLRHNVSAYDAAYVALSLRYGLPLVTLDLRLARAAQSLGVEVRSVRRDGAVI
ncbi:MAG TPA: type II toxin-antitoxin system VapC family toxin [Propionibacteriaceae bacterium]|nr:type II toxin-antitoxin system VapC family toxin [Propionibacteriaceae bacterium]